MPTSKQTPLSSPRGRSVHDFGQTLPDWEAAVFDQASYFAVVEFRNACHRTEFDKPFLRQAVCFARQREQFGSCLYAVTKEGRFCLLDKDQWDHWLTRAAR